MNHFRTVGITGLGSCLPEQIGPDQATSDLAVEAARLALKEANVAPSEVDLILVATIHPDMLMPATACLVQAQLGAAAPAFDLGAACPGFLYALAAGAKFVAAGNYRTVLVIGADVMSRLVDRAFVVSHESGVVKDGTAEVGSLAGGLVGSLQNSKPANLRQQTSKPANQQTSKPPDVPDYKHRDGAGAVVLQPEGPNSGEFGYGRGLLAFDLGADGRLGEALIVPAGGSRLPASMETVERRLHTLRVDAERFVPWAQHAFRGTVRTTLRRSGLRPEEIDLLVVHQAGPPDLPLREETLGFPAQRTLRTAETCGNAGAASLPIALDQARQDGRLQTGDRVLLVGLGGGLTWASAIVGW